MRHNIIYFLGICLLAVSFACNTEKSGLIDPGISEELATMRVGKISDIEYHLSFEIPSEKNDPIIGKETLVFNYSDATEDLIMDFNSDPDKIKSIAVNGENSIPNIKNEHIIISDNLLEGKNNIEIQFEAGEQSLNRHEDYLYTLFVPERASTCFPVFDQPDLKASYHLSLKIPERWKAVANGAVRDSIQEGNATIYHFHATKPISSYLFSFAAGDFKVAKKKIGSYELTAYHRETDSSKVVRNLDDIFEWHAKSLLWLEEYTGIKYPFEKFDFALIPSFQYGGMEHPGAILYKNSSLMLEESATLNQQLGRARLIAHEVSHMWFGNLVTMKWFDDVWLKEVFANFMAAKIVNPSFPEVNHDLKFLLSHYPGAYAVDRTMGTHPIKQPLHNLKNAGSLYGAIIYQKAPIVMRMLEENIGEDTFRNGMRRYLHDFSFGNASWEDLLTILDDSTSYNIDYWNKRWVNTASMPRIHYGLNVKNDKIKWFNTYNRSESQSADNHTWPQQLTVTVGGRDSTFQIKTEVGAGKILKGAPAPEFLFTNAGGMGYGYFHMGPDSKKYYLANVSQIEDDLLRGALWLNFYELMLREDLSPEDLMNTLVKALSIEKNALIADYLLDLTETLFWKFYTEEQRQSIAPKLEGLLLNMTINTDSSMLQGTYFNTLRSVTITDNGLTILKNIWGNNMEIDGLKLSENDYTTLAYEVAVRKVEGWEKVLDDQGNRITNPDRKAKFKFVKKVFYLQNDSFFDSLKDPENRENEAWVLEALKYFHHPVRAGETVNFIKPGLEMLQTIQKTGDIFFPKRWLDNTLYGHSSEEADEIVRHFLYQHNDYPADLKNKILQSADLLFRSVQIKASAEK